MNKKILALILSGILISMLFSACGTPSASSQSQETQPQVQDEAQQQEFPDDASILTRQAQREQEIFLDYEQGAYILSEPYIIQDPYELNPLSALALFESAPCTITVTVAGENDIDTVQYDCDVTDGRAEIPILGLYPGRENSVELRDSLGNVVQLSIKTEPLPEIFSKADVITANPDQMGKGMTFLSAFAQGIYAVDTKGDVRWRISDNSFGYAGPIMQLENARLAILGGNMEGIYYMESIYEIDFLGKVYAEYKIPGNSGHHEIRELPNGNLLVAAGAEDKSTDEDHVVEIDRKSGEIVKIIDLKKSIPMQDYIADPVYVMSRIESMGQSLEEAEAASRKDWFHNNSFYYNKEDNSLLLSARTLDGVFKIDYNTGELFWVLTDPEAIWAQIPDIKEKLLTPTGDGFEYQYGQHSVQMLPNGDIMLFDNGCFRSKDWNTIIDDKINYSRAVSMRVNESDLTVEQLWQYGKERGSKLLSCYVSNIDPIASEHYLINFGGITIDTDGYNTSDNFVGFTGGTQQTVLVEVKNNQVVFEMELTGGENSNAYRAYRMDLYNNTAI